jgi:hypothetical protein
MEGILEHWRIFRRFFSCFPVTKGRGGAALVVAPQVTKALKGVIPRL